MTTTLYLPDAFGGDRATVEGEAHHHLFRVKRLQAGERLRVVDGKGHARFATIAGIDKRAARLDLGEPAPSGEPEVAVALYVAAAKPERLAWLVEKATELGVVALHFVATDRQARSVEAAQLSRWGRIAVSAVEQSGRSLLPELSLAGPLAAALDRAVAAESGTVILDGAGARSRPALPAAHPVAIFVGPEGGWSPEERRLFSARELPLWTLGPTTLRVETAAVVAAGVVLAEGGLSR